MTTINKVSKWIEKTVYYDNGVIRHIFKDEDSGRLFFHAHPLDFDRDDTPVKIYWLDEKEGWDPEFHDLIVEMYSI
jgi:hypothetical protein